MPIFDKQMRKTDFSNVQESLKEMANHIRYIQEQLEYTLMNLDSRNITEIDTDDTTITSGTGGSSFTGNNITINGKNGESFEAGVNAYGNFTFKVNGKNGIQNMYLDSTTGELVITKNAALTIDGGTW